ncbi:uncharacterized protein L199_008387 [Kwoniella botswanensis]|uniref:uncharacterized protein n=1 Tax=Kwoniella botswanensis TaxID=1268659 RepID=UPI00315D49C2
MSDIDFGITVEVTSYWASDLKVHKATFLNQSFVHPNEGCEHCAPPSYNSGAGRAFQLSRQHAASEGQLRRPHALDPTSMSGLDYISRDILGQGTRAILSQATAPNVKSTCRSQFWGTRLNNTNAERLSTYPLNQRAVRTSAIPVDRGVDPDWTVYKLKHTWESALNAPSQNDMVNTLPPGEYCP